MIGLVIGETFLSYLPLRFTIIISFIFVITFFIIRVIIFIIISFIIPYPTFFDLGIIWRIRVTNSSVFGGLLGNFNRMSCYESYFPKNSSHNMGKLYPVDINKSE